MQYVDSLPVAGPLEAALRYARNGWLVFPCHAMLPNSDGCTCGNQRCLTPGEHALFEHGEESATLDEITIRDWWVRWPGANIGIVTGRVSHLLVIDVDVMHGGSDSLLQLEVDRSLPKTLTERTPDGSLLFYFHRPANCVVEDLDLTGIAVHSDGEYVIAPSSLYLTGSAWAWNSKARFEEAPAWLAHGEKIQPTGADSTPVG